MRTNRYELTSKKKGSKPPPPVDPADLDALVDARLEQPPPSPTTTAPQQQVMGC